MDENTNVQGTGTTAEQEKTFSQSEVDSLIQTRLERERKKYPSDDELTAFRSWRDSQRTQEERMEALTGERDTLSGQLAQAEAERDELYRQIDDMVLEDLPYAYLDHNIYVDVCQPYVKNYCPSALDVTTYHRVWLDK